jgi:uncharacterized protein YndB with AHSA1/START domain
MSATLTPPPLASAVPFVRQSRVIRASRDKVYEAWIKPEIMQQWFCPKPGVVPSVALDAREGRAYRIEIPAGSCADHPTQNSIADGVYTEVVPNQKLQFTWRANWNPTDESLVTVTFADAQGGTEVTILHERIAGDGGYEQGWAKCLESLAAVVAAK